MQRRISDAITTLGPDTPGVAVVCLDVDRFTVVNDALGDAAGDALLIAVATRLGAFAGGEDVVARVGPDDFAVLSHGVRGRDDVLMVVARLLHLLHAPFVVAGQEVRVSACAGVAFASHTSSADKVLRAADVALRNAKRRGPGSVEVSDERGDELDAALIQRELELHQAIERGELRVHFQPEIDLASNRVVGAEALARWEHPVRGMVLPAEFIPLAEDTGLIEQIGWFVLREACAQAAQWHRQAGADAPVIWVNISARQLTRGNIVSRVAAELRDSGIPGTSLGLEITETTVFHDVEAATTTLARLKELGVRIAVDDFGTGWSSLSYLTRLPVDVLKIDRSFIAGIGVDEAATAIVRAVVSMASALGLIAVAEGVERAEQADLLKRLGCPVAQGWLFAPALPGAAFRDLLPYTTPAASRAASPGTIPAQRATTELLDGSST